jgi:hypothetical protein
MPCDMYPPPPPPPHMQTGHVEAGAIVDSLDAQCSVCCDLPHLETCPQSRRPSWPLCSGLSFSLSLSFSLTLFLSRSLSRSLALSLARSLLPSLSLFPPRTPHPPTHPPPPTPFPGAPPRTLRWLLSSWSSFTHIHTRLIHTRIILDSEGVEAAANPVCVCSNLKCMCVCIHKYQIPKAWKRLRILKLLKLRKLAKVKRIFAPLRSSNT